MAVVGSWLEWKAAAYSTAAASFATMDFVAALMIAAGLLSFYLRHGGTITDFINELMLSFSVYPMDKMSARSLYR
jgi:hypothetical protein